KLEVYALRVKSAPFGHNAPPRSTVTTVPGDSTKSTVEFFEWADVDVIDSEDFEPKPPKTGEPQVSNVIYLDGAFEKIQPESWVVVDTGAIKPGGIGRLQLG